MRDRKRKPTTTGIESSPLVAYFISMQESKIGLVRIRVRSIHLYFGLARIGGAPLLPISLFTAYYYWFTRADSL